MSHSRLSGMYIRKDRMVGLDEFKARPFEPGFVKERRVEHRVRQVRIAEICTKKCRLYEPGDTQHRRSEFRSACHATPEKGTSEVCFNEIGSTQGTELQRCQFEAGPCQGCPVQGGLCQLGATKLRALECCFRKVASREVGIPAITAGKVGLAKVDAPQRRAEEADPVQILSDRSTGPPCATSSAISSAVIVAISSPPRSCVAAT